MMKINQAEEITLLRMQLMSLVRRMRRESRSDEKSWGQLLLLGSIDRHGGDVTPSQLAESENMHSSNLAAALRNLETDGLLTRTPDTSDRRKVRVALTPEGLRLLHESRVRRETWLFNAIASCLSDEERALLIAAGHLMARIANVSPLDIAELK